MSTNEPNPGYLDALARVANLPIILQLDALTVFQLVSVMQLALRHPSMTAELPCVKAARAFIDDFADQLRAREPLLAELLEKGDDPKFDNT